MKRCHSESLYIPLSVSWHRDKGRAAVATLMLLNMGRYTNSSSTYMCAKFQPSLHCNELLKKNDHVSIWWMVKYSTIGYHGLVKDAEIVVNQFQKGVQVIISPNNAANSSCHPPYVLPTSSLNRCIMLHRLSYQHLFNVKMFAGKCPHLHLI